MIQDLRIQSSLDGIDLVIESNDIALVDDLGTMILLSLFGGDSDWFGNDIIEDKDSRLISKTVDVMLNSSINSQFRQKLQTGVLEDLAYLKTSLNVKTMDVNVRIINENAVSIDIKIDAENYNIEFDNGVDVEKLFIRKL